MHRYQYQLWKSMQYRYRYFPIQYNIVWALTIRTVSVLLYNYRINSTVIFLISNKSILNIRTSSKLKNRQFTVTVINYIKRSKSIATKYRNTLTKNVSAILYWYSTKKSIAIAIYRYWKTYRQYCRYRYCIAILTTLVYTTEILLHTRFTII
jgi:hypothetical protein